MVILLSSCNSKDMNHSIYIHINTKNETYFSKYYYILPDGPLTNVKPSKPFKKILNFNGAIQPIIVKTDNTFHFPLIYVVTKLPYFSTERHYEKCRYGIYDNELFIYKKYKKPYSLLFLVLSEKDKSIRVYPANMKPIKYSNIKQQYIKSINKTVKYIEIPQPDLLPHIPNQMLEKLPAKIELPWSHVPDIR